MMNKKYNKVKKNAVMQYVYVFCRYVFPLITLPYLTRVLGAESYGVRSYIVSFMLFMQTFADFGFNLSGAKEIVKNIKNKIACCRIMGDILYAKLIILVVLSIFSIIFCSSVTLVSKQMICVIIAFLGVSLNTLIPDFLFIGKEEMGIITSRFIAAKVFATGLIILFVKSPDDLILCFIIESLGSLLAFVLSWRESINKYGIVPTLPSTSRVFDAVAKAFPFFLSNASIAAMNALATICVGIFLNDAVQVAYWSISITALNAILSLYNPIANALYPHMVHSKDFKLFRAAISIGTLASAFGAACFAIFSGIIIMVLGGDEYLPGKYILIYLSPVLVFAYPALLLGSPLLGALGQERALAKTSIMTIVLYGCLIGVTLLSGYFSLKSIAVCRVLAELFLLLSRGAVSWKTIVRDGRRKPGACE